MSLFFSISNTSFAHGSVNDGLIWKSAYEGDFPLVQKMILAQQYSIISDDLINNFILAYVHYRAKNHAQIVAIFEGIDRYLEHEFNLKSE